MRQIEFTKDFATKKKGDILKCDSMLAARLVREDKVANYIEETEKPKTVRKSKK